jgi:transcription initiation factor TFIIIB Brf1 subunit/transcription initiation factor TFIIB
MTYPAFDTNRSVGETDTRTGPVTCTSCGCRLERSGADGGSAWYHFAPMAGRDARGCMVDCADDAHDASGRAPAVSAA